MAEIKPRLLLADDHEDLLREVSVLLRHDFELIGTARDGFELLESAATLVPDIVITDFKMPGLSGLEAGRRLLDQHLCKAVVLLTMYGDPQLVRGAREAGILGFVLKEKASEDLIPAVFSALEGRVFVSSLM
ncbi:MAG TPA: response regulator transcription factor [Bryobacteraceae bacterium]|jgi:DNA-binding NarL/FixJ family response regulator